MKDGISESVPNGSAPSRREPFGPAGKWLALAWAAAVVVAYVAVRELRLVVSL